MAKRKRGSIEHARQIRAARSRALFHLEEGETSLREVLRDPPGCFLGVDLWPILLATKGVGKETARDICQRAAVWPHTELGQFTRRQRFRIIDELPERIK